jgi:hypothetical protein
MLPKVQETRSLFARKPYAFPDFVGKAMALLQSAEVRAMGFEFDPARALPCKWKCADESLYGVDLAIYAQTGHYPFDKGKLGGRFNDQSLGAAVHHGPVNVDFGGSHVGYAAGEGGGTFGTIWRPQHGVPSTDCGYLCNLLSRFQREYDDAIQNILVYRPAGAQVIMSVPNEFVQPNWSARSVKLLVDTDTFTDGEVDYDQAVSCTHTPIGRTLFRASKRFLDGLDPGQRDLLTSAEETPIGSALTADFFSIFDVEAELDPHGLPQERLLLYMKYILAARHAPPPLKAAIINANIEHNHLTDTVRAPAYQPYAFASFSGVFLDLFDDKHGRYATLFQPLAIAIKPAQRDREYEMLPGEIHDRFDALEPAQPAIPMSDVLRMSSFDHWVEQFTFDPSG